MVIYHAERAPPIAGEDAHNGPDVDGFGCYRGLRVLPGAKPDSVANEIPVGCAVIAHLERLLDGGDRVFDGIRRLNLGPWRARRRA